MAESVAERWFAAATAPLLDLPTVRTGTMLHSPAVAVDGKYFAFVGMDDRLIVKVPAGRVAALVAAGVGEPLEMRGRAMREWVAVPVVEDDVEREALCRALLDEALAFVEQVPATEKQAARARGEI